MEPMVGKARRKAEARAGVEEAGAGIEPRTRMEEPRAPEAGAAEIPAAEMHAAEMAASEMAAAEMPAAKPASARRGRVGRRRHQDERQRRPGQCDHTSCHGTPPFVPPAQPQVECYAPAAPHPK